MYDAQLASAKQLGTTQKEFLDSQLKVRRCGPRTLRLICY